MSQTSVPPARPVATGASAFPTAAPAGGSRALRGGCWLVAMVPTSGGPLDGTLRVDRHDGGCTISGDLYRRAMASPAPAPDGRVPIFPIAAYAQYLGGTALDDESDPSGIRLGLRVMKFDPRARGWLDRGDVTARLAWQHAPAAFPSLADYLEGEVFADGQIVARMSLGWITPRLRRVTVEIDTVSGCEQPIDNGAGFGWPQLFDALNWDGAVHLSDTDVAEPAGGVWSDAALHQAMLARRERIDLDREWHYHILSVRRTASAERGLMYDDGGSDADNVPREGCALAAHWPVPAGAPWSEAGGMRFGQAGAAFFRAAVHELGHAFGLDHNVRDLGFMNTSEAIAAQGTAARPFSRNIGWAFAPDDLVRLRHDPDIVLRPGGVPVDASRPGGPGPLTDEAAEPEGLRLEVAALLGEVPIGAPVRVNVALVNGSGREQTVPARLSLKTDFVSGRVVDPSGRARGFRAVVGCIEDRPMRALAPGGRFAYDLTLLRGREGALFPMPGLYRVEVEVCWPAPPATMRLGGATSVFVTSAHDAGHAAAAHHALATPELHLILIFGGDHLADGLAALDAALADPVLAPHYAAIEMRRRGTLTGGTTGLPALPEAMVMSVSERAKLAGAVPERGKSKRKRVYSRKK